MFKNKKQIVIVGVVAFLLLSVPITVAWIISLRGMDERARAEDLPYCSEVDEGVECIPDPPFCSIQYHGKTYSYETETWPSGNFCFMGTSDPTSPAFPDPGATTYWGCIGDDGTTANCWAAREPAAEPEVDPPICSTNFHMQTFSYETETWPPGDFCAVGTSVPSSPSFPDPGTTTSWSCISEDETSVDCWADREPAPESPPPPPPPEPVPEPPPPVVEAILPDTSIFTSVGSLVGLVFVLISAAFFVMPSMNFSMRYRMQGLARDSMQKKLSN